ncbi:MAG: M1 family aminopeptidase [Desulfobacteraceae bacterium]
MTHMILMMKRYLTAIIAFYCLHFGIVSSVAAQPILDHDLHVRLEPQRHSLVAEDRIRVADNAPPRLVFFLAGHLKIEAVQLNGQPVRHTFSSGRLTTELGNDQRSGQLLIAYRGGFTDQAPVQPLNTDNPGYGVTGTIGPNGTLLLAGSGWYPQSLQAASTYTLSIDAPKGILGVTAGRNLGHHTAGGRTISKWRIEQPLRGLSLSAGPFQPATKTFGRITAATYFTPALQDLSQDYLEAIGRYLAFYEKLLGAYPFDQFSVVENFFPTGYGFPSYTLMGRRVLRLPFIIHTSLGHEIAHCWWGNGVLVDAASGNWSEGLTSYVADYLYKERRGSGVDHRRQWLRNYTGLVQPDQDFALNKFISRTDPATSAVGYDKAAMVFHMLRRKVGDDRFWQTLRDVYAKHLFEAIDWRDWQTAFEASYGKSLETFFQQWVYRAGAPQLFLSDTRIKTTESGSSVSGILAQRKPYYALEADVVLETANGIFERRVPIHGDRSPFSFSVKERPLRLTVDPQVHLFRRLDPREMPPTVNSIKGADALTVVVAANLDERWKSVAGRLCTALGVDAAAIVQEAEFTLTPADRTPVLWIGQPVRLPVQEKHFTVDEREFKVSGKSYSRQAASFFGVFKTDNASERLMGLFLPESFEQAAVLIRKIPHYGKYSYLVFRGPRNQVKQTWPVASSPVAIDWSESMPPK